jgi:bacillolysin
MTRSVVAALFVAVILVNNGDTSAQSGPQVRSLNAAEGLSGLRDADRMVTVLSRNGDLVRIANFPDTIVAGREHERFQQTINGVPVWATTVTRQHEAGVPISVFGSIFEGSSNVGTTPRLTAAQARAVAGADAGVDLGEVPAPLYVLMTSTEPHLVYAIRVATPDLRLILYFVDAVSGAIVKKRDDVKRQVGTGSGVFGPDKKISTTQSGGTFIASDALRPPVLATFNFRGNPLAVAQYVNGLRPLAVSDYASDADNRWTDGAAVDAHVYAGWTYDYLFKRFGRMGLDNRDLPIINIVHPANRADIFRYYDQVPQFFANAGYYGQGLMIYGDGLPSGLTLAGQSYDYLAGALDVVSHELTHGVTDFTSGLEYEGESGALNEAFSDIIGTSVEFFFQSAGPGRGQADYLLGEDVVSPGAFRSMSDPRAFGDIDHYSLRYTGTADDGGVHTNSGIANQAFYLAIEGGRNATSGLAVTGVGAANREQIEQVFYRAFTSMLPSRATFSTARAATIQAARDLYGASSAPERAVIQAWTAVGVF